MRLIIDFTENQPEGKMIIVPRRHLLAAVAGSIAAALLAIYLIAHGVAAYWISSGSAIASDIARAAVHEANEDRNRLWRESLDILETDIAELNSRILALYNKGATLSDRLGLPGDKMFAVTDSAAGEFGSDPLLCDAAGGDEKKVALETQQMDINTDLLAQTDHISDLERKYSALREQSIHDTVALETVPLDRPLLGRHWVSSRYGYRRDPFTGKRAFHAGDDYAARRGTPIIAAADGIVIYAGRLGNYGNAVHLYHGDKISTLYGHMHKIYAQSWQYVKQGEVIGTVGSTGRSTGSHLHYEVRIDNRPKSVLRTIKELRQRRYISRL